MHDPCYSPPNPAIVIGSHPSRPLRVDLDLKNGPTADAWSSFLSLSPTDVDVGRPVVNPQQPSFSGASPPVSKLARRIHGWSWQAFPMGMGTGAVYVTLSGLEEHPGPLTKVEAVFFCINVLLFILNSSALFLQALLYPQQSWRLINDPVKGLFVPIIALPFGTIIIGIIKYGAIPGHISPDGIYVLFWIYVFLSVFVCFLMLMIWFNKPHDVTAFRPFCVFLILPMMFVGVLASNVLQVLEPSESRAVGVLFTGFLEGRQANGAFMACGPPGLTALALINLGSHARKMCQILPQHSLISPLSGEIWYSSSVLMGLHLFGLAVFFFIFGLLPYGFKVRRSLSEILGCQHHSLLHHLCDNPDLPFLLPVVVWALTSPNMGWISSLRVLGSTLQIPGLFIVYTIMAVAMCMAWAVLFGLTLFAFWKGKTLLAAEADVLRDKNPTTGDVAV
ncbi:voltage-dependent anion channel-domain-containing protein [Russula brevipes]|nr:voltage-dependent anion channel-domain-containing protein [Russula brevipes]